VRRITGIRRLSDLPETRWEKRGEVRRAGYRIEKIVLHPDRAIPIPALLLVPDGPASGAALYLDAAGKQKEAAPGGALEQLARGGQIVLAPDLCGLGETAPAGKHSYASFLPPEWREATIAYLLGESLLAIRCEEILLCARFLAGYGEPAAPRPIQLTSIGRVGPPTLHAAALEADLFATVTLRNSLVSWSNVVHTPLTKNQNVNLVHGALRKYDLPDLVKTLPEEKITLIEPLDAAEKQL